MDEVSVRKKVCCCKIPRWELIVWGYIKLFIANLLLIGTCFGWAGRCGPQYQRISNSLTTIVASLDILVTGVLIFACNMQNLKAIKVYHYLSQLFLALVTSLCIYELVGLIILYFDGPYYRNPIERWIYQVTNKIFLFIGLGVYVYIFKLVGRLINKLDPKSPEEESLFQDYNDDNAMEIEKILTNDENDNTDDALIGG